MDLHHLLLAGLPAHSALPPIADSGRTSRTGLAREIFTSQAWSVRPCVRPVDVTCGRLTYIKFEIWKIAILQTVVTSTVKDASVGKSNNHKPKVAYEQFVQGV